MSIVKKILITLLSLSILAYSSAWAFDGHVIEADSNENLLQGGTVSHFVQIEQLPQQKDDSPLAEKGCCDHCCHISAHLQAIFNQSAFLIDAASSTERLDYSEHFISFIVSPDLRPPRV